MVNPEVGRSNRLAIEPVSVANSARPRSVRAPLAIGVGLLLLATACSRGDSVAGPGFTNGLIPPTSTGGNQMLGTTPHPGPLLVGSQHVEVRQYTFAGKPTVFDNITDLEAVPNIQIPQYQPDSTGYSAANQLAASFVTDCYVTDPARLADPADLTRGVFYHVLGWADPAQNPSAQQGDINGDYVVTNTEWNQLKPGGHDEDHRFDPSVPPCPGVAAVPNTGDGYSN